MLDTIRAKRNAVYTAAKKHKIGKVFVFGSCARREERPDSDIDLLVEFEPGATLFDHVHMRDDMVELFRVPVDVVSTRGLDPYIAPRIEAEAVSV